MTIATESKVCGMCRQLTTRGQVIVGHDDRPLACFCSICWRLMGFDLPAGMDTADREAVIAARLERDTHLDTVVNRDN